MQNGYGGTGQKGMAARRGKRRSLPLRAGLSEPRRPALPFHSLGVKYQMDSESPSRVPLPHKGWFSLPRQLPGTGERIWGMWAVLKADTQPWRKTRKSYTGREKIMGEPAREMSTKNLTVREKQGEEEVEGGLQGARAHPLGPIP